MVSSLGAGDLAGAVTGIVDVYRAAFSAPPYHVAKTTFVILPRVSKDTPHSPGFMQSLPGPIQAMPSSVLLTATLSLLVNGGTSRSQPC
jgi:hypothetical protein